MIVKVKELAAERAWLCPGFHPQPPSPSPWFIIPHSPLAPMDQHPGPAVHTRLTTEFPELAHLS